MVSICRTGLPTTHVDSTQFDFPTGVQGGVYAIFLENVGRNVRPSNSQSIASQLVVAQPAMAQPVTVVQPKVSQPPITASIALSSVAAPQSGFAIVERNEMAATAVTSFEQALPLPEISLSVTSVVQPVLTVAQANFDFLYEEKILTSSVAKNALLDIPPNSALELKGAFDLLDEFFSVDIDDPDYEEQGHEEQTDIIDFDVCDSIEDCVTS